MAGTPQKAPSGAVAPCDEPHPDRAQGAGFAGRQISSRYSEEKVTGLGVGKSDEWMTPPYIFEALGERFDLDVAAPRDGPLHVPTSRWLSTCGLDRDWFGFVWMNPPFGGRNAIWPWLNKFTDHGNGIALTPDRTSSPWFHATWARADAVLFCRKTPFLLPDGSKAGSPAFGTALWACGERAVNALRRAEAAGLGILAVRYSRCSEGVAVDREARGGEGGADAADRLVDDVRTHRGVAL